MREIVPLVSTAVGLAMGVAFVVLSALPNAEAPVILLGIGLFSLSFGSLHRLGAKPGK